MSSVARNIPACAWGVVAVVGIALPFLVSDYDLFNLTRVLALAIAVASLNLLLGHSGQISVGHGAIFGIGGYAALIPVATYGWSWWAAVLLALACSFSFGVLLGLPALRMGGPNLGMLTIAVAAIFPLLLIRMKSLTGGTFGIFMAGSPIRPPSWVGLTIAQFNFLVCLVFLALTLIGLHHFVTGRSGRALAAVRTSPLLAAANGVNVDRTRLTAFVMSSTSAGLGGALYALVLAIAVPDSYLITFSITLLAASVVGGSRSWAGAIIGAAIVIYLPAVTAGLVGGESSGNWSQLLYALALIVSLLLAPAGLAGAISRATGHVFGLRATRQGQGGPPPPTRPPADLAAPTFTPVTTPPRG